MAEAQEQPTSPRNTAVVREALSENLPNQTIVLEKEPDPPATAKEEPVTEGPAQEASPSIDLKEVRNTIRQESRQERGNLQRDVLDPFKKQMKDALAEMAEARRVPDPEPEKDGVGLEDILKDLDGEDLVEGKKVAEVLRKMDKSSTKPTAQTPIDLSPILDRLDQMDQRIQASENKKAMSEIWDKFASQPENDGVDGPAILKQIEDEASEQGYEGTALDAYVKAALPREIASAKVDSAKNGKSDNGKKTQASETASQASNAGLDLTTPGASAGPTTSPGEVERDIHGLPKSMVRFVQG